MLNDGIDVMEQLIDAIEAKVAQHGAAAPASVNLRKDAGVIEPCTLLELLHHVKKSLDRVDVLRTRVQKMLGP